MTLQPCPLAVTAAVSSNAAPLQTQLYTVSQKNDTDVVRYNFNAHQPILVVFLAEILLSEYASEW